ncbi:hypothetical protein DFH28DRAFT_956285 [Melampsora americana]|nr:hypothetical protein DFH28DRAFT_956285 [Melampsora americana]
MKTTKIIAWVQVFAVGWYIVTQTSAMMTGIYKRKHPWEDLDIILSCDVTHQSTGESLAAYLDKNLEEKKHSGPFLSESEPTHILIRHRGRENGFGLINEMLQSKIQKWPKMLRQFFRTYSSCQGQYFWRFISQLSEFMPTPALQVALFELQRQRRACRHFETRRHHFRFSEVIQYEIGSLDRALAKCQINMKNHIESLRNEIESKRICNIFTKAKQNKLGMYRICLKTQWPEHEERELFKYWASHMDIYIRASGDVKRMMETQAILSWLVKAGKKASLKTSGLSYEVGQLVEHQLSKSANEVGDKLVHHIDFVHNQDVQKFLSLQEEVEDPLILSQCLDVDDIRKVIKFWAKNRAFYLQLRSTEKLKHMIHPLEDLIRKCPEHMDAVLNKFTQRNSSSKTLNNLTSIFLDFFLANSSSSELRQIFAAGGNFLIHP